MKLNVLLYADDMLILSKTHSDLQNTLNACKEYFKKWKLELNVMKTKIVVFNHSINRRYQGTFYYGSQPIEIVSSYKYLGLRVDQTLSFKNTIADLVTRGKRAYAALHRCINIYDGANPKTIMKLFDTMISPILLYCSEVWAPYILKGNIHDIFRNINMCIEKFHTSICKRSLGMKRNVSNIACRTELGRLPLTVVAVINCFKYYLRLNTFSNETLLGQAVLQQKSLNLANKETIFSFIQRTVVPLNLNINLYDKDISKYQINNISKKLRQNLAGQYTVYVIQCLKQNGKLEIYTHVKSNNHFERYLFEISNLDIRKAISKLRLSAHKLPIEKGRLLNIPRHQRYCELCSARIVGDEFHILMECTNAELQEMRMTAYYKLTEHIPQFRMLPLKEQFFYVFSFCDSSCTRIVAPFIKKAMTRCEKSDK